MNIDAFARECLAAPWKHAHRSIELGMDCAGPLAHVLTRAGVTFTDSRRYGLGRDNLALYEKLLDGPCERCEIDDANFLLFKWEKSYAHAAVLTSEKTLIHIFIDGKVFEEKFSEIWRGRVVSAWRIR